jgi:glutathione S-transferase
MSWKSAIPTQPRQWALCHALEEWSDEALYFIGLYYQWFEADGRKMVPQAFGRGVLARAAYQYYKRVVLKQIKGHGTSRKTPEHVRSDLKRQLDALAALVNPGPFLLGEKPFLCDFAIGGQLVYLGRTPVGARLLAEQPAIDAYRDRLKGLRR